MEEEARQQFEAAALAKTVMEAMKFAEAQMVGGGEISNRDGS